MDVADRNPTRDRTGIAAGVAVQDDFANGLDVRVEAGHLCWHLRCRSNLPHGELLANKDLDGELAGKGSCGVAQTNSEAQYVLPTGNIRLGGCECSDAGSMATQLAFQLILSLFPVGVGEARIRGGLHLNGGGRGRGRVRIVLDDSARIAFGHFWFSYAGYRSWLCGNSTMGERAGKRLGTGHRHSRPAFAFRDRRASGPPAPSIPGDHPVHS